MTDQLHTRSFTVRALDTETRTFSGIAVPWDTPVEIRDWFGEYTEQFTRGAVRAPASGKVLVCYRHGEEIGLLTKFEDRDEGWYVEGKISETARGNDAYALLRDGVTEELSIGFWPVKHEVNEETGAITRTDVVADEVSLVPWGAYGEAARVSEVRHKNPPERTPTMPTEDTDALRELREEVTELGRSLTALTTRMPEPATTMQHRTAGAVLRALVSGDADTIREYNELMERAYTGGTTADAPMKDGWVGDLTRIFDSSSGALSAVFETGTLPATGMSIEFAELKSNSVAVKKQENEGDDLTYGKVELKTRTAEVHTYGGYTQLTRQAIERSTLPLLNRSLEALAMAAGVRKKIVLRDAYASLVAARVAAEDTVDIAADADALGWLDAVVDAAINFETKGATIDALLVSPAVFKALNALETDGHRVLRIGGHERTVGSLDLTALRGDLASLTVICDTGQTDQSAAFVNGRALRQYDSAVVSLQDENVINLSKDFSVYKYGAVAAEIPGFVVPVKFGA